MSWNDLLRRTWQQIWDDRERGQSAMLSFYLLPSILLLLRFLKSLIGPLLQLGHAFQDTLRRSLAAVLPKAVPYKLVDTTFGDISEGNGAIELFTALTDRQRALQRCGPRKVPRRVR